MKPIADERFEDLLSDLASRTPAPGGGAAGGMLGATAASLASMVVAYSIGKKTPEADRPRLESAAKQLDAIRSEFLTLATQDAEAYAALNAIQKRPADDPVRITDEPAALLRAIETPESTRELSMQLLRLIETLVGHSNRFLLSDLAIAGVAAEAAAVAAGWNVRVNAPGMPESQGIEYVKRVAAGDDEAAAIRAKIELGCRA